MATKDERLIQEALDALREGLRVLHQHRGRKRDVAKQMRDAALKLEWRMEDVHD